MEYSSTEMIACLAARLMAGQSTAFIGTGIPLLGAALAKKLYAPDLIPVFEFGGIGSTLEELPLGVGEARTFRRALAAAGICDVMETAQRGLISIGLLGGAQIDVYGNLNTTVIGSHDRPKVRLPGSGGGNDVGSLCWRTVILMKQDKKRFVKKLDFLTTPGYLRGGRSREKAGLAVGTGPYRVVTDLGLFDFEPASRRMRLIALNPGVGLSEAKAASEFSFLTAKTIIKNEPPTEVELKLLREELDREKIFRKTLAV